MIDHEKDFLENLPNHQIEIRNRCFHPSNNYVAFEDSEVRQSITRRFEIQVEKYPDNLAVKSNGSVHNYQELNYLANQIGRHILLVCGERKEPIALLLESGVSVIAAMFGVLKTNKFYVPLDPLFPNQRIKYMMEDSSARVLITDNQNLALAQELAEDKNIIIINIEQDIDVNTPGLPFSTISPSPLIISTTLPGT